MKPRTIVVMSILLALCVGYVVISQWGSLAAPPDDRSGDRHVFPQPLGRLTSLTIQANGRPRASFALTDGEWRITSPVNAKADPDFLRLMGAMLRNLKFSRKIPQGAQSAGNGYGLATPTWQLQATDDAGRQITLLVGSQAPAIGSAQVKTYVRTDNKAEVYVIDTDFDRILDRPVTDFIDRQLLARSAGQIGSLTFRGQRRYSLSRTGDDWQLALSPELTVRADSRAVGELISLVAQLRARGFLAVDDEAGLKLTEGNARLALTISYVGPTGQDEPAQTTILLGEPRGDHVVARLAGQDGAFLLDGETYDDLLVDPSLFRSTRMLLIRPADVQRISISGPGGQTQLTRTGAAWRMIEPLTGRADQETVEQLLQAVSGMQALAFHDAMPAAVLGLDEPRATLTLHLRGGEHVVTIGSQAPDGDGVFARADRQPAAATISAATAQILLAEPNRYISRDISSIPAGAKATRLVITRPNGTFAAKLDDQGHWQMLSPTAGRADDEIVQRIIECITGLRAESIASVSPEVPSVYSDARENTISVALTVTGGGPDGNGPGTKTYTLRVVRLYELWSDEITGDFAWETMGAKPPIVAKVGPGVYQTLMSNLTWRRLWDIDPATIRHVQIARGADQPVTLQLDQGQWTLADDPYARVDITAITNYLQAVKQLDAHEYLTDTVAHLDRFGLATPWLTVQLTDSAGEVRQIIIADHGPGDSDLTRYASVSGLDVVLLISAETVAKLQAKRDGFLAD